MNKDQRKRVELHVHTNMDSGIRPAKDFIDEAIRDGMPAIAITDRDCVQAFPKAYREIQKTEGIKLIYGMESYKKVAVDEDRWYHYSISLLAKNKKGLTALYRLLTKRNTGYGPLTTEDLEAYRKDILVGDMEELFDGILDGKSEEELEQIAAFYDYIILYPLGYYEHYIQYGGLKDVGALIQIIQKMIALGERLGKKVVASDDAHTIFSDDEDCRELFYHLRTGHFVDEQPERRFRTTEEMLDEFRYLGEDKAYALVVQNTNAIADGIADTFPPFPEGWMPPVLENADRILQDWAVSEAKQRYGRDLPAVVEERLTWELEAILKHGHASIFLLYARLADAMHQEEYPTGIMGAVGASFVSYLLGITEYNPLPPHYVCPGCHYTEFAQGRLCGVDMPDKECPHCGIKLKKDGFHIPAETFFGLSGDKMPDIILTLATEENRTYADRILGQMFGEDKIVHAGAIAYTEWDDAAYLQYCKRRNLKYSPDKKREIRVAVTGIKERTEMRKEFVFVIPSGYDISDFTPLEQLDNGDTMTHLDFHDLHDNLFKATLLLNSDLGLLKALHYRTGVDPKDIPLDDRETMDLIASGKAASIENELKQLLTRTSPQTFSDLVRVQGLIYRCCTEDAIQEETPAFDWIYCRDEIMLFLLERGMDRETAFLIMEWVRKGKAAHGGLREDYVREIEKLSGIPDGFVASLEQIAYLFPKAHCVAHALTMYRIAYYEAHFPELYFSLVLQKQL